MVARRALTALVLLAMFPAAAPAIDIESVTFGISHAWTGNGYVPTPNDPGGPYDFAVTGSEASALDPFVGVGMRVRLTGSHDSMGVVTLAPSLEVGRRPYLLFASGRVVPTQIESAAGNEDGTPGIGSAQVTTLRVPLRIGYELRPGGRHALSLAVSPTLVFRIAPGDLPGMRDFFFSGLRFLMPEVAAAYRVSLGDRLETTFHATYGVSIGDLLDTTLPPYDQMRIAAGIDIGIRRRPEFR